MWNLQPIIISVSLVLELGQNEMMFYGISELILPTLIQRYDKKNHFSENKNMLLSVVVSKSAG